MSKPIQISLACLWILISSALFARLWLAHPELFPAFPTTLAEYLVNLYGAQNAEEVADLEILVGLCLALLIVSVSSLFGWLLWHRIRRIRRASDNPP